MRNKREYAPDVQPLPQILSVRHRRPTFRQKKKVNKTSLMFTPITSKIKHVETNERRGYSDPITLLS